MTTYKPLRRPIRSIEDLRTKELRAIYNEYSDIAPENLTAEQFELLRLAQDELDNT
jgi:hypothetical protein